jgi:hypothetical protein
MIDSEEPDVHTCFQPGHLREGPSQRKMAFSLLTPPPQLVV